MLPFKRPRQKQTAGVNNEARKAQRKIPITSAVRMAIAAVEDDRRPVDMPVAGVDLRSVRSTYQKWNRCAPAATAQP